MNGRQKRCIDQARPGERQEIEVIVDEIELGCMLEDLWDPLESTCRHASLSIL